MSNIRDVIPFPLLKPEKSSNKNEKLPLDEVKYINWQMSIGSPKCLENEKCILNDVC